MSITLQVFKPARQPGNTSSVPCVHATDEDATSTHSRQWFVDTSKGAFDIDLDGVIPLGSTSGATSIIDPITGYAGPGYSPLTGPSRATAVGKDVVVQAHVSGRGYLAIEDTPDGTTWTLQGGAPIRPGVTCGLRFAPGAEQWRVRYYDDGSHGSKKVLVLTQVRDPGV